MPPKKTGPFSAREKVLVPHTDQMYEAKVMKCEKREDMWYYFIHYQGWGKKWDEWVEATGLFKFDPAKKAASPAVAVEQARREANLPPLSPELNDEPMEDADSAEPGTDQKRKAAAAAPLKRPEKRRKANDIAPQNMDVSLPADASDSAVDIYLPAGLKQILLDEMGSFADDKKATSLPHNPTVADILAKYVESERSSGAASDSFEQFASGLRTYFDKALHNSLLYDEEVEECKEIQAQGLMPSGQYGANHLLRLLVKLPSLIPVSSSPAGDYDVLQDHLALFINFLSTRQSEYFTTVLS